MSVGRIVSRYLYFAWFIAMHVSGDVGDSGPDARPTVMTSSDTSTQRPAAWCVREPGDGSERTPGDHGFRIKIIGQQVPALYTPGQVYTSKLRDDVF